MKKVQIQSVNPQNMSLAGASGTMANQQCAQVVTSMPSQIKFIGKVPQARIFQKKKQCPDTRNRNLQVSK